MRDGRVVPFLGAGASLVGRADGTVWQPADPRFLPTGRELAQFLAEYAQFPAEEVADDLAKVSSYCAEAAGRDQLRAVLTGMLGREFQPGPLHVFLASLPTPLVIVVTNYDTLLEQAFERAGRPVDRIIHPTDELEQTEMANTVLWWPHGAERPETVAPSRIDPDFEHRTVIYKMHGSIMRKPAALGHFVITEEDYVDFLSRMTTNSAIPPRVYERFLGRSFLFLGYSLRDWNLRVILRNLSRLLPGGDGGRRGPARTPSWAIDRHPSRLETSLWETRGVKIYELAIDEFVADLQRERQRRAGGDAQ